MEKIIISILLLIIASYLSINIYKAIKSARKIFIKRFFIIFIIVLFISLLFILFAQYKLINIRRGYSQYIFGIYYDSKKIEGVDSSTFHVMDDKCPALGDPGSPYAKDKNNIYFRGEKIINANPSSFIIIDCEYNKDKNYVYYYNETIVNADPETFIYINFGGWGDYFKDKNYVFYRGGKIINADPETFEVLEDYNYSKDKNRMYYLGKEYKQ